LPQVFGGSVEAKKCNILFLPPREQLRGGDENCRCKEKDNRRARVEILNSQSEGFGIDRRSVNYEKVIMKTSVCATAAIQQKKNQYMYMYKW
jgi:hypothetical protein